MKAQLRMCSVHKVVEVLPGIWKVDRMLTTHPQRRHSARKEVACPACMRTVTEAFKAQFPALYTPAATASRKSA
jgi:hypothetical protein